MEKSGAYNAVQELMAMQENGPRNLGFFGTRNMGFMHQNLIEVLSYAMVLTVRKLQTVLRHGIGVAASPIENPCLMTLSIVHVMNTMAVPAGIRTSMSRRAHLSSASGASYNTFTHPAPECAH